MIIESFKNSHGLYYVVHHIRPEEEEWVKKIMNRLGTPEKHSQEPDYSDFDSICSTRSNK